MLSRIAVLAVAAALTHPAAAADLCKGGPKSEWKSPADAKKAAADLGYTNAVKVILEDGCYEVITLNADKKIVGVQFDPVTLKLMLVEEPR